jgi:hypothetical protein
MEKMMLDLVRTIRENVPELAWVDEDLGQLEAVENKGDEYFVKFPCALVSVANVQWETLSEGLQNGTAEVTIRVAVDAHYSVTSDRESESIMQQRLQLAQAAYEAVVGYCPDGCMDGLERKRTMMYARPYGIRVYENVYTCIIQEDRYEK